MKNKTKFLFVTLSVLFAALSVLTINLYLSQQDMKKSLADAELRQTSMNGNQAPMLRASFMTNDEGESFVDAAEKTVNTVVHIRTEIVSKGNSYYDFFGSLLEQLYGGQMQVPNNVSVGYGSGVVISPDGYIVTNNHVVEGASKIEVTFNDKHKRTATIIGNDPSTDLALIKVDAKDLEYLTFADSDQVRVGEWVLAVGNPFNLTSTVTAGIVSAKARNINILGDGSTIESFIQTDAAVNPGNSGGALVDKAGNLVGINTAIISQTGSYTGYSFAVPVNIVKKIVFDLMDYGKVQRAVLGITMQEIDDKIAEDLKLSSRNGVYIVEVSKSGAADAAGIKAGDVLIAIDSTIITNAASVQEAVSRFSPGDEAEVTVIRDGKEKKFDVKFKGTAKENGTKSDDGTVAFYGSSIKSASEDTLKKLGIKGGVEIVELGPGKLMEAGAVEGFVIQYVNDHPVRTPEDVIDVVKRSKRTVFIEGVTPSGKTGYFGFGV